VATEYVPHIVYSTLLANSLPAIGASFYERSAKAHFQTSLNFNQMNLLPFTTAVFVYFIDFFLKRLNSSTNQNGHNLLGNILRKIMWFILLICSPFALLFIVVSQR